MVSMLDQPWDKDDALQDKIINAMECAERGSMGVMQGIDQAVADKHPEMAKVG
jgi:hypothetical protein